MNNLNIHRTALITGATSGLGAAYAKYFANLGYNLIITGRRTEIINNFSENLRAKYNIDIRVIIVELSNINGLNILFNSIKNDFIDVLVNNAGFGLKTYFSDTNTSDIEKMLFLHTEVPILLTRLILPKMINKNAGTIINISSDGALLPMPKNVAYSSTKILLKTFTEGLHMELLDTKIKVQVVCPGLMKSHFHVAAGMNKMSKNSKGLLKFSEPKDIVNTAMKDLNNGKVVCIPGLHTKILVLIMKLIPTKIYYKKMHNFVKAKFK